MKPTPYNLIYSYTEYNCSDHRSTRQYLVRATRSILSAGAVTLCFELKSACNMLHVCPDFRQAKFKINLTNEQQKKKLFVNNYAGNGFEIRVTRRWQRPSWAQILLRLFHCNIFRPIKTPAFSCWSVNFRFPTNNNPKSWCFECLHIPHPTEMLRFKKFLYKN